MLLLLLVVRERECVCVGGVWAFSYVFVRFFQITSLLRSVGVATKFGVHSNVIGWDVVVWLYICCFVMEVGRDWEGFR